jgi:NADH-quinone oxidoreductase subunit L
MLITLALLPLLSPVIFYLVPDNKKIIFYVGLFLSAIALGATSIITYYTWVVGTNTNLSATWLELKDAITLKLNFVSDHYGSLLAFVTALLTTLIHIYAYGYLEHEKEYRRFTATFLAFCGAMIGLVFSSNLIQLFFFWEGVGLCSYFLIGYWHEHEKARRSSLQAFLYNRFGDVFLLSGILWLGAETNSYDLAYILQTQKFYSTTILIFIGVMAKSAQFPLHVWLPNAMTGPTPVSALLHSATMVAAGVLLMIRISPLMNADIRFFVLIIGSITALFGAFLALREHEFKRIWAYSSMSQLGLMMCGIGFGYPEVAYFHLITHAFFKCSLFLGTGIILHYLAQQSLQLHTQTVTDIRFMGGLAKKLPKIFIVYIWTALALIGFPLTSGFVSKEGILTAGLQWTLEHPKQDKWLIIFPVIILLVSFLTALYVTKTLILVYFGKEKSFTTNTNGSGEHKTNSHPIPKVMTAIFIVVSFFSLGYIYNPSDVLNVEQAWIIKATHPEASFEFGSIATIAAITAMLTGIILGWGAYLQKASKPTPEIILTYNHINMLYKAERLLKDLEYSLSDYFFENLLIKPIIKSANFLHNVIDRLVIDRMVVGIALVFAKLELSGMNISLSTQIKFIDEQIIDGGVRAITLLIRAFAGIIRKLQGGITQFYFLLSLLVLIGIFIWVIF